MSIESGGRFEQPYNSEDPFSRGIEARDNHGVEDDAERENPHWLNGIVSPESIERAKQYPLCEGWSVEQLIYQRLLGVLVESGPELNPTIRKRLRNLVGVFRMAAFSNMTPREQQSVVEWSQTTTFDATSLEYEINKDAIDDIRHLCQTFGLQVPPREVPDDINDLYRMLSSGDN
jgi:hypothetical protein